MEQLTFPSFPASETHQQQAVFITPDRQRAQLTIWERDDEPDMVVVTLQVDDGDGTLLVLRNGTARRDETWWSALTQLGLWAQEAWYETHLPFP